MSMLPVALGIGALSLLSGLLLAFRTLDQLVSRERTVHPDAWIADGRPSSALWGPGGTSHLANARAFHRCSLVWLFRTPRWVVGDERAETLLRRLRRSVAVWNVGLVALVAFALLVSQ
jgi:hypothetical protein